MKLIVKKNAFRWLGVCSLDAIFFSRQRVIHLQCLLRNWPRLEILRDLGSGLMSPLAATKISSLVGITEDERKTPTLLLYRHTCCRQSARRQIPFVDSTLA